MKASLEPPERLDWVAKAWALETACQDSTQIQGAAYQLCDRDCVPSFLPINWGQQDHHLSGSLHESQSGAWHGVGTHRHCGQMPKAEFWRQHCSVQALHCPSTPRQAW